MRQVLPSKHTPLRRSLLGQGTLLLGILSEASLPVAMLFALARERNPDDFDFATFVLTLDFLFMIGAVDLTGTSITRTTRHAS
ncbi:ABC-three component system middle component 6 [Aeromicrobium sp. CTD01-1L150]|uniref:ABC-three component system middle component 6 n=1 Tax=Aeromicrobium sp. CTD01-1L150 TaxID=3341830 RepID=UPI0035C05960